MNTLITSCLILCTGFLLPVLPASAQSPPIRTATVQSSVVQSSTDSIIRLATAHATSIYYDYIGDQLPIYNGMAHLAFDPSYKGSAYFLSDESFTGSAVYEGLLYSDIHILYDLVRDQLVVLNRDGYPIDPNMDKVHEFSLSGHRFIHTAKGVYDQLVTGFLTVMVRRTKKVEESIVAQELIHTITAKDYYYVVKGGVYYPVHDQKGLLAHMGDHKKEVKEFIRSSGIRFRKDPETAIVRITGFYDQLVR